MKTNSSIAMKFKSFAIVFSASLASAAYADTTLVCSSSSVTNYKNSQQAPETLKVTDSATVTLNAEAEVVGYNINPCNKHISAVSGDTNLVVKCIYEHATGYLNSVLTIDRYTGQFTLAQSGIDGGMLMFLGKCEAQNRRF